MFKVFESNSLKEWNVDSLSPIGVRTNKLSIFISRADITNTTFETGLTPDLVIQDWIQGQFQSGFNTDMSFTAVDGAGPVIKIATLRDQSTIIKSDDVVTVEWSEPLGASWLNTAIFPVAAEEAFNAFTPIDVEDVPLFVGAECEITASDKALIKMVNQQEINLRYHINVDSATSGIQDQSGNRILFNNRKAPITRSYQSEVTVKAIHTSTPRTDPTIRPVTGCVNDECMVSDYSKMVGLRILTFVDAKLTALIYDMAGNYVNTIGPVDIIGQNSDGGGVDIYVIS